MALHKVLGIETEFGIIVRGGDSNPIAASSVLINAYVQELARAGAATGASRVGWDFEDEQPGNDARGFSADGQMPPEVETHLVNAVLTNGARYYVDHAHPELSTPECADPRSIVKWDRAAEVILQRSMVAARRAPRLGARGVPDQARRAPNLGGRLGIAAPRGPRQRCGSPAAGER